MPHYMCPHAKMHVSLYLISLVEDEDNDSDDDESGAAEVNTSTCPKTKCMCPHAKMHVSLYLIHFIMSLKRKTSQKRKSNPTVRVLKLPMLRVSTCQHAYVHIPTCMCPHAKMHVSLYLILLSWRPRYRQRWRRKRCWGEQEVKKEKAKQEHKN